MRIVVGRRIEDDFRSSVPNLNVQEIPSCRSVGLDTMAAIYPVMQACKSEVCRWVDQGATHPSMADSEILARMATPPRVGVFSKHSISTEAERVRKSLDKPSLRMIALYVGAPRASLHCTTCLTARVLDTRLARRACECCRGSWQRVVMPGQCEGHPCRPLPRAERKTRRQMLFSVVAVGYR